MQDERSCTKYICRRAALFALCLCAYGFISKRPRRYVDLLRFTATAATRNRRRRESGKSFLLCSFSFAPERKEQEPFAALREKYARREQRTRRETMRRAKKATPRLLFLLFYIRIRPADRRTDERLRVVFERLRRFFCRLRVIEQRENGGSRSAHKHGGRALRGEFSLDIEYF